MSNVARVAGQAANTLVKPLEVEDLFSTYLYTGTGSSQTITNGIDLDGEGGLVWFKTRARSSGDFYSNHFLYDSARGLTGTDYLHSNKTDAEGATGSLGSGLSFLTNGFTTGPFSFTNETYVSWAFRKTKKFFDVVTYTGNGPSNTQNISHNLGSAPGMLVVRATSTAGNWHTWHRGFGDNGYIELNTTIQKQTYTGLWDNTAPTATHFTVSEDNNTNNVTYVAYLFAHNDGDGEFGPDGNADIVKCGSYTHPNNTSTISVNLGFEPQWILLKADQSSTNWYIFDVMRGIVTGGLSGDGDAALFPNTSGAENVNTFGIDVTPTGFDSTGNNIASGGNNVIYVAIRRPTAVPTSATEVFDVAPRTANAPGHKSGFVTDMFFRKISTSSSNWFGSDRLRQGRFTYMNDTTAEAAASNFQFDYMNGVTTDTTATSTLYAWMWKRAPSYFDVVAYTGNGTAGRTVSHNLGVAPEMMWVKRRDGASSWITYWESLGATKGTFMDTNAPFTSTSYWNDTAPTNSVFSLGNGSTNTSSGTFITYLFASLPGISKVGSFSHTNGTNSVVDCGFTSGARFVLLKRTDSADNWDLWDSARGINTGTEPKLVLNTSSNESVTDEIDPDGSGFIYSSGGNTGDYIFYAIA